MPSSPAADASRNPIIVALDAPDAEAAAGLVRRLAGKVGAFKIGLELFNAAGPAVFARLRGAGGGDGARFFYDAKFHDIPNTVAGAVRAAVTANDLWMINVHASGGAAMMRAAVDAAGAGRVKPRVIAVTLLTSIDQAALSHELGIAGTVEEHVARLARLARESGCDGVVASPLEVAAIRAECGPDFLIVTPGVRPSGTDSGDQKRVMTPSGAMRVGASYLVIGRPITQADDPGAAAEAILAELG